MFKREKVTDLNEYFTDLNGRRQKGVFFSRINGYNEQIGTFVQRYYEEARKSGVIIEGKIPNPDDHNLSYYNEIMGMDFYMDRDFICTSLGRWLPRMNDYQRGTVADAIYGSLDRLMKDGKNLNMLKNAYIKFMCWLYYKFERIVSRLEKILFLKYFTRERSASMNCCYFPFCLGRAVILFCCNTAGIRSIRSWIPETEGRIRCSFRR